jgi:PelA/Pel-15E family pectate lyase
MIRICRYPAASVLTLAIILIGCVADAADAAEAALDERVSAAIRRAATFYREQVAVHGGYVYFYSLDLKQRWGEGMATPDQIWVQPPGTPTVGMAFLKAYEATGDAYYLDAAREAAEALVYGQLQSGGWSNSVDLSGRRQGAKYQGGDRRREGTTSLDDGQTQSAIRLVVLVDKALGFRHDEIHTSALSSLDALLAAQFANGGFPQGWKSPVAEQPVMRASYPEYDWKTEGRIKNYWDMYTLNDNVCGYVADALIDAYRVYREERYLTALRRLGDFLMLAQMPDPQPGWAQQYNDEMKPIWARKFEPPALAGDESQEVLETLLTIHRATGDARYLEPFPRALAWLKKSQLPDGRLARYYELKTNRPLYVNRRGDTYTLTYDDSRLPSHYGWKIDSRLPLIEQQYNDLRSGRTVAEPRAASDLASRAKQILDDLDELGRWVSTYRGERLVGQPKMQPGAQYLSSEVFSVNLTALSEYLAATASGRADSPPPGRKWTDQSGQFSVRAEFVEISGDTARLRREDGEVISVPIGKLSEPDRG